MDNLDVEIMAAGLVEQADYSLLLTLSNASYVDRYGGVLYQVMVPESGQIRFGMFLVYEEFMLTASDSPLSAALSTPAGVDAVLRFARTRLAELSVPKGYEVYVRVVLWPAVGPEHPIE